MEIKCPKCKEALELPEEAIGAKVQCPFCNEVFIGTRPSPEESCDGNTAVIKLTAASGKEAHVGGRTNRQADVFPIIQKAVYTVTKRYVELSSIESGTVFTKYVLKELLPADKKPISIAKQNEIAAQIAIQTGSSGVEVIQRFNSIDQVRVPCMEDERLSFWEVISKQEEKLDPAFRDDRSSQLEFWRRCSARGRNSMKDIGWVLPYASGVDAVAYPSEEAGIGMILGDRGCGKTTCLNSAICTLALFRQASSVRIIILDPEGNLPGYNTLPHSVNGGTVTGYENCRIALRKICEEIDRRHEFCCQEGVDSIRPDYNVKLIEEGKDPFPTYAVFIDNIDGLVRTGDKEVFAWLSKLSFAWHEGFFTLATSRCYSKREFAQSNGTDYVSWNPMLLMRISDSKVFNKFSSEDLKKARALKLSGEIVRSKFGMQATYITKHDIDDVLHVALSGDDKEQAYRNLVRKYVDS